MDGEEKYETKKAIFFADKIVLKKKEERYCHRTPRNRETVLCASHFIKLFAGRGSSIIARSVGDMVKTAVKRREKSRLCVVGQVCRLHSYSVQPATADGRILLIRYSHLFCFAECGYEESRQYLWQKQIYAIN